MPEIEKVEDWVISWFKITQIKTDKSAFISYQDYDVQTTGALRFIFHKNVVFVNISMCINITNNEQYDISSLMFFHGALTDVVQIQHKFWN